MKVLVVGSGGREHALVWKIAQSEQVSLVYVAPGNAGTYQEEKVENIDIGADDINQLVDFALNHSVELTVIGPEVPLAAGIVDQFQSRELSVIGPTRSAAMLESSKQFSKDFMRRHNIPTAAYRSFSDKRLALDYLGSCNLPVVIKADGLAAGKGVLIADSKDAAVQAVESMMSGEQFGEAGRCVVIEEFLDGEELSFICLVDGEYALPLATSRDHKTRDEGGLGPNTGGMGAYSPVSVTDDLEQMIIQRVIAPVVAGMKAEGRPLHGFLYAGLMIDSDGQPRVLEFNCRLGDPEAQPLLMRLRSDITVLFQQLLNVCLSQVKLEWDERVALGVVLASGGYPDSYQKGHTVNGLEGIESEDVKVFHAATGVNNGSIVTTGGRVLCVTALGSTIAAAQTTAYHYCEKISWPGMFYRKDIGSKNVDTLID